MRRIKTNEAPAAVGAYAQGAAVETPGGELVFTAGQIGLTADGELVNGVEAQTYQAMANLRGILGAAGCKLVDVVKAQVFITDADDYQTVNRVYAEHFDPDEMPVRECVVVASIPYKTETEYARVEISMVAQTRRHMGHRATALVGGKQIYPVR